MRIRDRLIIALFLSVASVAACSGGDKGVTDPDPVPGAITVDVFTPGLVFSPAFVTIKQNDSVRWLITGVAHDVTFTAATGAPASIPVTANQNVTRKFTTKGTFAYDCFTHPGMSGAVTVQ